MKTDSKTGREHEVSNTPELSKHLKSLVLAVDHRIRFNRPSSPERKVRRASSSYPFENWLSNVVNRISPHTVQRVLFRPMCIAGADGTSARARPSIS
jgi:hypothetical protein